MTNGTIWSTGGNTSGQLGLGDTTDRNTLTKITSDLSGCTPQYISCGYSHTMVLMTNGTIWGTGSNGRGQLGRGNSGSTNILTHIDDIIGCTPQSISCGMFCTMVLMTNGSIWGTGQNNYGQLGLGDYNDVNVFTKITTVFSDCTPQFISCGFIHTAVLMTNGTIWTSGWNDRGQLGLGDNSNRNIFTKMTSDISGCTPQSISCNNDFTVVLMTDRTIWVCGDNGYGQLGLGDNTNKNRLTKITTNNSNFIYIAGMDLNPIPVYEICFPAGTPVLTDQGIVSIDHLIPEFHTINNHPIVDITKTVSADHQLVKINKDAFGLNCPTDAVIITKEHKILYEEKLYAAKSFVDTFDVELIPYNGINLYNVLLDEYSTMNINGLICETLHPNNLFAKLYTKQCKYDIKMRNFIATSLAECLIVKNYEAYDKIVQLC
jgi:hypothetical protein